MSAALAALRDRAVAMLQPGHELAVCTDAQTDPELVAIAIARPHRAFVMTVSKAEYNGLWLAEQLGFPKGPKLPPQRKRVESKERA